MDTNQLWAAILGHKWILAGAIGVGALVAAIKAGWLGTWLEKLPSRYRPFLTLALSMAGVFAAEVQGGTEWKKALFDALMAASFATMGHASIVHGIRGGKELLPPAPWSPKNPKNSIKPPPPDAPSPPAVL